VQKLPESEFSRICGIDYGQKRIGIALSDPTFTFAYSFLTIKNDAKVWQALDSVISEKKIIRIILGYPTDYSAKSSITSGKVMQFKDEILKRFNIEIILWDEKYTSAIAQRRINESVWKRSSRRKKGIIDSESAAIILQEYLDSLKK
jgi:putative Holliday junction resolvase